MPELHPPTEKCTCGAITIGAPETIRLVDVRHRDGRRGLKIARCSMCPDRPTRGASRDA